MDPHLHSSVLSNTELFGHKQPSTLELRLFRLTQYVHVLMEAYPEIRNFIREFRSIQHL